MYCFLGLLWSFFACLAFFVFLWYFFCSKDRRCLFLVQFQTLVKEVFMASFSGSAGEKELRFYQGILEWGPVVLGIAAVLSALAVLFGNGDELYYSVAYNGFVVLTAIVLISTLGLFAPSSSSLSVSGARIAKRSFLWIGILTLISIIAFLLGSGSQENALNAVIVFAILILLDRLTGFNSSNGEESA